jgi:hypothetical protein
MIKYHHLIHRIKSETYAKGPVQGVGGRGSILQAVELHSPPPPVYYQTIRVNGASFPRSLRFRGVRLRPYTVRTKNFVRFVFACRLG